MPTTVRRTNARLALRLVRMAGDSTAREARAAARTIPRRFGRRRPERALITEFDPLDPAVLADPYPWYRRLHASGPLHYNRRRGMWIVSGYDAVRDAARAHDALSSAESVTPARAEVPMMIAMDRPAHTRLRKMVARHFTRQALERWRPALDGIVREAFDSLPLDEPTDAVPRLAGPVPVEAIAELLGVPRADRARFREWSDRIVEGFSPTSPAEGLRTLGSIMGAAAGLHTLFRAAFAERRTDPREDLLSHLTASSEDGGLSPDELFWFAVLLLVAGNETTTSLLGTMLLAFADNPAEYERLRADPRLAGAATEESLRFASPIQGLYRTALRDYDVGGATIPARDRVLLLFGAANRDPARYRDPDRFVVGREPGDHLAFGSGIHFCLGAHLARLETELVLEQLLARVRAVELSGRPEWIGNPSLRGPARLPVILRSA